MSALLVRGIDWVPPEYVEWSGANSLLERDKAARLLAERLDALRVAEPSAKRLVIGHSHGGNVCLRAFAYLREPADDLRVATIATPFVELLPGMPDERSAARLVLWTTAMVLLIRLGESANGSEPMPFVLRLMLGGSIALLLGWPLGWLLRRRYAGLTVRLVEASGHAAYRASRAPTLVLRGVDDEASLTLGFGAIAARLSRVFTVVAIGVFEFARGCFVLVSVLLSVFALVFASVGGRLESLFMQHAVGGALAVTPVFAVLLAGFAAAEGVAPVVFGRELLLKYLDVQVNSNSAPDAGDHVRTVTLPPGSSAAGLRHALYAHPDCAEQIVEWLGEVTGQGPTSSTPPPSPL